MVSWDSQRAVRVGGGERAWPAGRLCHLVGGSSRVTMSMIIAGETPGGNKSNGENSGEIFLCRHAKQPSLIQLYNGSLLLNNREISSNSLMMVSSLT